AQTPAQGTDYQRAMDEVLVQLLPVKCSGGLLPAGSELCPRPCGTRCCCPVGFRASFSACVPCDSVLRDLPVIYLLPADSGRYVFLCMALLALLLTPWPWALLARLGWASALQRAQEEPVLRYLLQQCRQHLVEDWLKRKDGFGDGPVKLQVSSLSGYSQELSFSEKALVVQLRGAASAAFEANHQLGPSLVFAGGALAEVRPGVGHLASGARAGLQDLAGGGHTKRRRDRSGFLHEGCTSQPGVGGRLLLLPAHRSEL
ncbi:unnamed protein product, partial [Effrenium voratum]